MKGRTAKLLDELGLSREEHSRNTAAAERKRSREADRAGADDDDAVVLI
jgi:hypothetical protein